MLKRLYFPVLLVLVVLISYSVTVRSSGVPSNSYLQIEVAPRSASIELDGRGIAAGKVAVPAANHTVTVSKKGFATKSQTVSAKSGQTVYVGIGLESNSSSTRNWYTEHPDDQHLAEGLGSHEADYLNQLANQNNSFLRQLPTIYGDGNGGIVTVAQGVPLSSGGLPGIYVTAATPALRQGVLTYMSSRGYNPATMDIFFYGQNNPLDPTVE
ncbi:MAG TPA: PEGA domain-containing protein [Candidatus Saccharimonadales bacterium]